MPEFVLDTAGAIRGDITESRPVAFCTVWRDLDAFTRGYIEALFFTSEEDLAGDDGGAAPYPQSAVKGFADLAPETLAAIIADCAAFQRQHEEYLEAAYGRPDYSAEQAGRDFWFTRCGHGVGFWDRSQLEGDDLGRRLSGFARAAGNVDAYLGDDSKVYLS